MPSSQAQIEQDTANSPGWTVDDQKPGVWDNFGPSAIGRGVGQGVSSLVSTLSKSLQFPDSVTLPENLYGADTVNRVKQESQIQPWEQSVNTFLEGEGETARRITKELTPDSRTTGSAANLLQGFAKTITEFTAGSAAGGALGGAAVLGTSEGYARYLDLKDQNPDMDEDTAKRAALLAGVANGAGAILPMKLPVGWLEGLAPLAKLGAQAAAGAAINTSFGVINRLGDAAILRAGGYPQMADQAEPWDKMNLAADAIAGMFFGAHAGVMEHGVKLDPSALYSAMVVKDRNEFLKRAIGVPVDNASAAMHRDAMESSLNDLLSGRELNLDPDKVEGASFLRPQQDAHVAADIIREEFDKSGVMDAMDDFDKWIRGEEAKKPEELSNVGGEQGEPLTPESVAARKEDAQARLKEAGPEPTPEDRARLIEEEQARLVTPESVRERLEEAHGPDVQKVVADKARENVSIASKDAERQQATDDLGKALQDEQMLARTADPAAAALADRPDMTIPHEGKEVKASDALEEAKATSQQVDKEADTAFTTAVNCAQRHS